MKFRKPGEPFSGQVGVPDLGTGHSVSLPSLQPCLFLLGPNRLELHLLKEYPLSSFLIRHKSLRLSLHDTVVWR